MKKILLFSLSISSLILFNNAEAHANTESNTNLLNFMNQDDYVKIRDQNKNYAFLHNDGHELDLDVVNQFVEGDLEKTKDFKLLGIGKYEDNNNIYTDFIFSNSEDLNAKELKETAANNASKTYLNQIINPFSTQSSKKDYLETNTFNIKNGTTLAGIYTSNVDYLYKGSGNLSGKTVSVWDVKYFNQSVPKNGYQTREILTKFSVYDGETIRSYGPSTTTSNFSASISLSGLVPSVSWSFNTNSGKITDNSNISGKYTKWTYKPSLGSDTAKNTAIIKPGVRISNSYGQAMFKTEHTIDYYKNLNSQKVYTTGALTRFLNDR